MRELQALLRVATPGTPAGELRSLLLEDNIAGKRSASSRQKVWIQLRGRYLLDPAVEEYRAFVAAEHQSASPRDAALVAFLMFARSDRLFREVTDALVSPNLSRDGGPVDPKLIEDRVQSLIRAKGAVWSPITVRRVQQHILSTLKDFGLLKGSRSRRTVRPQPGTSVSVFAVRLARLEGLTERQVLDARWFRLLGLDRGDVTDLLYTAARAGALRFRMQADVVELSVPALEAA